jgi:hypothetical protein
MWEPRRLTPLWTFTACYRDSFAFLPLYHQEWIRSSNTGGWAECIPPVRKMRTIDTAGVIRIREVLDSNTVYTGWGFARLSSASYAEIVPRLRHWLLQDADSIDIVYSIFGWQQDFINWKGFGKEPCPDRGMNPEFGYRDSGKSLKTLSKDNRCLRQDSGRGPLQSYN